MTSEQATAPEQQNIEITMEDLQRLWQINPLAQSQFQNIIDQKQIAQLKSQLAEQSNGHKPDIFPTNDSAEDS